MREDGITRLKVSKPAWCTLTFNPSAASATHLIAERKCDVLVIDPTALRRDAFDAVTNAALEAGVGVLLYTAYGRDSLDAILHMFGRAAVDLLYTGVEHEGRRLERCLATLALPAAPSLFLHATTARVRRLSPGLQLRLLGVLGWMPLPATVEAFFAARDEGESTWRRELARVGFASPHVFLQCVQLLRSWDPLQAGERAGMIADQLGLSSEKEYRRRLRRHAQCSPRDAHALEIEEFVRRIVASACRGRR